MHGLLLIPLLIAHPYHVSLAEMEYNPTSARWEVALRLHPNDLDAALSHQEQRRVVLENASPEAARRMATDYLTKRFRLLRDDAPRPAALHWVGMEAKPKFVWWYFELEPPAGDGPLRLENRVLMEIERTQANTVNLLGDVLGDGTVPSLRFTAGRTTHPLPVGR